MTTMRIPFVIEDEDPGTCLDRGMAMLRFLQCWSTESHNHVIDEGELFGLMLTMEAVEYLMVKAQQGIKQIQQQNRQ